MAVSRPKVPPEVLHELRYGHKLEAIRLLRCATGMGLKEAKDIIEELEAAPLAAMEPVHANIQQPAKALPPQVVLAILSGQEVQAIRLLREHTGMGLKDAVDTIKAHTAAKSSALAPGEQSREHDQWLWLVLLVLLASAVGIWLLG